MAPGPDRRRSGDVAPMTDALTPSRPAPQRLKLVVVSGPDFGTELLLDRGTFRVGKEPGVDLCLSDTAVSRTHLLCEVLPHGLRAKDNNSRNGSFFQGVRFDSVELTPPAVIRVGRTELQLMPADAAPGVRPSVLEAFGFLQGRSLAMRQLFAELERIAPGSSDVLVEGETGTGKEVCARAIHAQSPRAQAPFVVCDLAGMSDRRFEAELFGEKGAPGAFERGQKGTVFLDEVDELSPDHQLRLLRVLESREVKRLGESRFRVLDLRVIASTQVHLEAAVEAGQFRKDLYHRLAVVRVRLPPLRERLEDLSLLVEDLLLGLGKSGDEVGPRMLQLLRGYAWPGNVRELRNVIERVLHLGEGALPADALPKAPQAKGRSSDERRPFKRAKEDLVDAFEREYVVKLLADVGGNVSSAARAAQVTRAYFQRLMRKHGLRGADAPE